MTRQDVNAKWRIVQLSLVHLFIESEQVEVAMDDCSSTVLTDLPYPDLNMAIMSTARRRPEVLQRILDRCRGKKSPCLIVSNWNDLDHLSGQLQPVCRIPLMRLETSQGAVTGEQLQCCQAADDREVAAANETVSSAFEIPMEAINAAFGRTVPECPGLRVYVAYQSGRIVSSLRISRIGETAVLWCMATMSHLQRQGIGQQLLHSTIASELQTGAREILLLATSAGIPLYNRVGFITLSEASAFLLPGVSRSLS
jgi:GNAT superfamily N-acetyltransferase